MTIQFLADNNDETCAVTDDNLVERCRECATRLVMGCDGERHPETQKLCYYSRDRGDV